MPGSSIWIRIDLFWHRGKQVILCFPSNHRFIHDDNSLKFSANNNYNNIAFAQSILNDEGSAHGRLYFYQIPLIVTCWANDDCFHNIALLN